MKPQTLYTPICLLWLMLSLPAMAQQGFTNKDEAKNKLKYGVKYGKWIEYFNQYEFETAGTPTYYRLTEYKDGEPAIEKYRRDNSNIVWLDAPPYGIQRWYYMNGIIYKETSFATDTPRFRNKNGVEKEYYKSGKLRYERPYTHNVLTGLKEYYESGSLKIETPYAKGKANGIQKTYFENGNLQIETPFTDDHIDGVRKTYFASGKLESETPYTDNDRNGVIKEYYENGTLKKEDPYTNGRSNGVLKSYYKNGKLEYEDPFTNNRRNGVTKLYYESGKLQKEAHYIDGKENGVEKSYYENGKMYVEAPYTDGRINGVEKIYFETGQLQVESAYADGKREGVNKVYDNNGNLISESFFINDKKTADVPQTTQDVLNSYIKELQTGTGDDTALRKKIISIAHTIIPPLEIPEEANRHLVMGKTAAKLATDASGYADAIAEFKSATLVAPWLSIAYFNLAVIQETSNDYKSAIKNFNFYLLAESGASDATDVKTRIYELEYKAGLASKKQAELDQAAVAVEEKKKQTHRVLDQLKAIVGNAEYWWYVGSVGDYTKGGRYTLNMNEAEKGGNFWTFGTWRSKYVFKEDKVFLCTYASTNGNTGQVTYEDLNTDKAQYIGTPNGPRITDIVWEAPSYVDQSGKTQSKRQVWVQINESNGDFYVSGNRPLTNPDRDAGYNYWLYQRK